MCNKVLGNTSNVYKAGYLPRRKNAIGTTIPWEGAQGGYRGFAGTELFSY